MVGLRTRAILSTMRFTACRAGAVAKLHLRDFQHDGEQYVLRFQEKGGKFREIPVRLELQRDILAYLKAAGLAGEADDRPLFRSAVGRTKTLTEKPRPDQEAPPGGAPAVLRPARQPPRLRHQPGGDRQGRALRRGRGQDARDRRDQVRTLFKSIDVSNPVGLRDRAILAVLVYTAARVGAVAKLTLKSFKHDGTQYTLRFSEKGGKSREIPVRHDLEQFLREYIEAAEITEGRLFRTAYLKTKTLTKNAMTGIDICRMMKRRLKDAGLPGHFSPHSFRVNVANHVMWRPVMVVREFPKFGAACAT